MVSTMNLFMLCEDEYERKGRLYKKSLNSDKFKERTFVLDQSHLFYFKSESQSKSLTLLTIWCRGDKFQLDITDQRQNKVVGLRVLAEQASALQTTRLFVEKTPLLTRNRKPLSSICVGSQILLGSVSVVHRNQSVHRNKIRQLAVI